MKIKVLCLIISSLILYNSCSLNGFMSCPKYRNVNVATPIYINDDLAASDSLKINLKRLSKNKYQIDYKIIYSIKQGGHNEMSLCNLNIEKEESEKDEITIHLTPYLRSIGKSSIEDMGKTKLYILNKKTKEKFPSHIKRIKFIHREAYKILDLSESERYGIKSNSIGQTINLP